MTQPVGLYLQDAHSIEEAIGFAQAAEAKGFESVWLIQGSCVSAVFLWQHLREDIERKIGSGVIDCWTRNPANRINIFNS